MSILTMPRITRRGARLLLLLAVCSISGWLYAPAATALDLLPDIFDKPKVTKSLWKLQEQYVSLATQGKEGQVYPSNTHPTTLDNKDVEDALRSLELWDKGGFFRNEESNPVFTGAQAEMLGRFIAEGLMKAKPNEDVIFNVRGYGGVALNTFKEREWTAGRAFFVDGKLNIIIGTFKLKKDRGVRNAEAAHGVLENYADLYFDPGSRDKQTGKFPGRIVATAGISYKGGEESGRPDWVMIDVAAAALAYREGQIPEEQKRTTEKTKQEAAKLTLERREMREEMARLRAQIKALQGGTVASAKSLEERLATLQALREKNLITDEEYAARRDEILKDI